MSVFDPAVRDRVLIALREKIVKGDTIRLPAYDPALSVPGEIALQHVGIEPNPFGGVMGFFRFQFEGEDDLLHLFISRIDGSPCKTSDAQALAEFLLPGLPPGQIWYKPGELTHHFYFAHDLLL